VARIDFFSISGGLGAHFGRIWGAFWHHFGRMGEHFWMISIDWAGFGEQNECIVEIGDVEKSKLQYHKSHHENE